MRQRGILYGVGVGPGDPQLMTFKAVDVIRRSDVIAVADSGKAKDTYVAYEIAKDMVPELKEKERIVLSMPMIKDADALNQSHENAAAEIAKCLAQGKQVAFLTLGDPSIYSTYLYVHRRVLARGYEALIIPGIPSFCAVAAKLGDGLAETNQPLHIIPASYDDTEKSLAWKGTKILMKMGRNVERVIELLAEHGLSACSKMVQNCGMSGETVWNSLQDRNSEGEPPGYFSMIIVKGDTKE